MTVKDVLSLWSSWDSRDIFSVTEGENRRNETEVTGLELVTGPLSGRSLLRFGSFGKQADGTWKHYVVICEE